MKLVKPGDTTANIILGQNPVLKGIGITISQLEHIFEIFGNKVLLILDGLDEIDVEKNKEIMDTIKGRKLLYCNVLATSRPHNTANI